MMGRLVLAVARADRPWQARIQNGPDMARTCVGLAPEEARTRLASLFSLCGAAHAAAATQALGLPEQDRPDTCTRDILRDHALDLLHTWPRHLGLTLDRAWLARTLSAGNDPTGNEGKQMAAALTGLETPLSLLAQADFDLWLESGLTLQTAAPLAAVLAHLRAIVPPAQGETDLPAPDSADLQAIAAGAQPPARDASILADHRDTPLLHELIAREGVSLFVRVVARALDLLATLSDPARLFVRTRALAAALSAKRDGTVAGRLGVARAARGLLVHNAAVHNGRVSAYTVLSPTGWHMVPDGLLSRCLHSLPLTDSPALLPALLISAINPCVPTHVEY